MQKISNTSVVWIVLFLLTLTSSCSNTSTTEKEDKDKLLILTTTQIIADGVKHIVGDKAEVMSLMGSGVDPHLYKAAQSDLIKMNDADIIISNGLHLEGKMADILHKYGRQKTVLEIAEGMDSSLFRKVGNNTPDPHLWFNIAMWKSGLAYISQELQKEDTKNSSTYAQNWTEYAASLDALDAKVQSMINEIPVQQRALVTAHDAFGYFAIRYGLEVKSLQGLSTLSNPGLKDIAELLDYITTKNIKAVFTETSVPKKNIEVLVDACQSKGHQLKIGGELYSDALGEEGTKEGTYEGAVLKNTSLIVNALK